MCYAIYAESASYVHLVTASSQDETLQLLYKDLAMVGVELHELSNVFAVHGNSEDIELEDEVNRVIKIAKIKEGE